MTKESVVTAPAPKPCPFCGYSDDQIEEHADGTKWILHGPDDSKCPLEGSMIQLEVWNRRPQQSAEPVAWAVTMDGELTENIFVSESKAQYEMKRLNEKYPQYQRAILPLSASPGPSELVEEMEKLIQELRAESRCEWSTGASNFIDKVANRLRALITRHRGKS